MNTASRGAAVLACALAGHASAATLPAQHAAPGGVVLLTVTAPAAANGPPSAPKVYFGEAPVLMLPRGARHKDQWVAVVGIPLSQEPGSAQVRISAADAADETQRFEVRAAHYRTQRLTVPPSQVDLSSADLKRVDGEHERIHAALATYSPTVPASLRLHERCGFRVVGVYRRHGKLDGEWRDCVIVERLLD
jgi:hypothetical protein